MQIPAYIRNKDPKCVLKGALQDPAALSGRLNCCLCTKAMNQMLIITVNYTRDELRGNYCYVQVLGLDSEKQIETATHKNTVAKVFHT